MKRLLVACFVFLCIWLMYKFPHSMISPGELIQGHQELNNQCQKCHEPFWGISNDKCISCHKLSEIGKDTSANSNAAANEKILFHERLSSQKCSACHTDHKGINPRIAISGFSHEILSAAERTKCNSCHLKPSGNLHNHLSSDCNSCHNTNGWKSNVLFNHDMIEGPSKNNCASCHNKPDDSFHQKLNDNCDKCHSTDKWKPSTFDHSQYFILDKHHNAECATCHTNNNFNAYTCYGCHEHSESKIREKHIEEGISNFSDCSRCHRSGDEHDIRMNDSGGGINNGEIKNMKDRLKSDEKRSKKEHKGEKEHEE